MTNSPSAPLEFTPAVEVIEPDEAKVQAELTETLLTISRTTLKDEHEALRSVHAKSHGLLKASVTVPQGLPAVLAQGLFAKPGRHGALIRFSTSPGDLLPDSVSTPRGVAIRVLDVEGADAARRAAGGAGLPAGYRQGVRRADRGCFPEEPENAGRHHRQGRRRQGGAVGRVSRHWKAWSRPWAAKAPP